MKFSVDRESLLKPIQQVSGVVERRQALPILQNLLLEIQNGKLLITGTDLEIELKKNEDILKNVATNFSSSYVVGFAAETSDINNNAMQKLKSKNLDMIISNDVSDKSIGFNVDDNEVNVITCDEKIFLKKDKKIRIAREILKIIANNINK